MKRMTATFGETVLTFMVIREAGPYGPSLDGDWGINITSIKELK